MADRSAQWPHFLSLLCNRPWQHLVGVNPVCPKKGNDCCGTFANNIAVFLLLEVQLMMSNVTQKWNRKHPFFVNNNISSGLVSPCLTVKAFCGSIMSRKQNKGPLDDPLISENITQGRHSACCRLLTAISMLGYIFGKSMCRCTIQWYEKMLWSEHDAPLSSGPRPCFSSRV